jgi:hypothetical protein
MIKTFKIGSYRVAFSLSITRFIGFGIDASRELGLGHVCLCLPFVDISIGLWSKKAIANAASELSALANVRDVNPIDWSIYAPRDRQN